MLRRSCNPRVHPHFGQGLTGEALIAERLSSCRRVLWECVQLLAGQAVILGHRVNGEGGYVFISIPTALRRS